MKPPTEPSIEEPVMALPRSEKGRLLAMIARDLGDAPRGVASTAGVSGGEPCLVRTGPVWVLERA